MAWTSCVTGSIITTDLSLVMSRNFSSLIKKSNAMAGHLPSRYGETATPTSMLSIESSASEPLDAEFAMMNHEECSSHPFKMARTDEAANMVDTIVKTKPKVETVDKSPDDVKKAVVEEVKKIEQVMAAENVAPADKPKKAAEVAKEIEAAKELTDVAMPSAEDVKKDIKTETVVKAVVEAAAAGKAAQGGKQMYHTMTKFLPHKMGTGELMKIHSCYGIAVEKTATTTDVSTFKCPSVDGGRSCPTSITDRCELSFITSVPHELNVKAETDGAALLRY